MVEFFIAKKHIFERKKQSIISIIGIMIGITVLIVSIGISNGLNRNMINSILSLTSHVVISDGSKITDYDKLAKEIGDIKGVKGALPTVDTQGIFKYDNGYTPFVTGVKIEGYDLEKAKKILDLNKKIVDGAIETGKINKIIIGSELFRTIGANIGDEVTIISAENKEVKFKIMAVFQSGFYEYDKSLVILPLKAAQYLLYGEEAVNKINVNLYNPYEADKLANKLNEKLVVFSRSWGELNRNLLSALSLEKTVMIVVFSLIVVIAGFVVWATLNMLVREKIKDIGIMRAMGYSKGNIIKIFLIQGLILGGTGIILGVIISLFILWYLKNYGIAFLTSIYYLSNIPIEISLKEILVIVVANVVIIFLSSIFPAYRASKMETVEALRYE